MPPITRGQEEHDKKKSTGDKDKNKHRDKHHVLKKGGGHGGGRDDDSVDSHGNIHGLIDYDYDSDETHKKQSKKKHGKKDPAKQKYELDGSSDSEQDTAMNFKKYSKNGVSTKKTSAEHGQGKNKAVLPSKDKTAASRRKGIKNECHKKDVVETVSDTESEYEFDEDNDEYENEDEDDSTFSGNSAANSDSDEDSDEDDDDNINDDDGDDETYEDSETNEKSSRRKSDGAPGAANILFTFDTENIIQNVPRRHNMKKESPSVKKFVKLLTEPMEDNTIDTQIDQFKALSQEKQKELLEALERRPTATDTGVNLMLRILTLKLPRDIQAMILAKYNALQNLDPSTGEYYKMRNWLDKVVGVPFGLYKEMPVRLDDGHEKCGTFMGQAKKYLDNAVFGQDESKLQILQFISTKIANPNGRGLSLLLVGPPGVGKTSLIKNGISKALGWPFQFISLGGDSDASTYTGHQLVYESSHCGKIVNSLIVAKSMSCVLLFDEVDKISSTPKGEEVQNLLIHLTDPVQNADFEDKYLTGVPIDLSKVMFVFSANDISKIDKVLLDRLMVIQLNGYDMKQKIQIAENYLLPAALKDVNLVERVGINRDVIQYVVEHYASEESGVRELKRCLEQIVQKVNMLRMYNDTSLPFYIKDFTLPFVVKREHVDLFIKKRENLNAPPQGMYI